MNRRKLALAVAIAALVVAFFALDLGQYLDLGYLQSQRDRLHDLFVARPIFVGAVFFAPVTEAGMVPALLVFVNAGNYLGEIESITGILSPSLLLSFLLLGLFPLAAKETVDALRSRRRPHPPDWV